MKNLFWRVASVAAALTIAAAIGSCGTPPTTPAAPSGSLQERIARGLAEASPPADPRDAKARDAAGEKLARFGDLLDAAGDRVLWGGFNPEKGYAPKGQRLTEFSSMVWAKIYLSTFTFAGTYEIRKEDGLTIVEVGAKFRDGLDSGDYPYPFWHSEPKWRAYVNTQALMLIFDHDRLVAVYRKSRPDAPPPAARKWDGRWTWSDAQSGQQPRVTLFTYLLSADNPSTANLDRVYRALEGAFRQNHCVNCHSPDNAGHASVLTLLNFPNQALAARHSLVVTLRKNAMPPADADAGVGPGVADAAEHRKLLDLAEQFEREADAALSFERARTSAKDGAHR